METSLFFRGIVIGLAVAAPIGPMAILCVRRTLTSGRLAGIASGSGVALADAAFASIAALGLTSVTAVMVDHNGAIRVIGGFVLAWIGWRILATPAASSTSQDAPPAGTAIAFGTTFALTLTNPTTIFSFTAIFAGFGVATIESGGAAAQLVVGVFAGSMLWWCLLTTIVSLLRHRVTPVWLRRVNIVSGSVILGFAAFAVLSAL